ncbi:putative mucin-16, partial [Triplophysa rosa]
MAHRSQCSSAGDNPLDPNYLPPHYREEYRLAIDALVDGDLEGYYGFLQEANVVSFLSQTEIDYIKCMVRAPHRTAQSERRYMAEDGDSSSDTYWPVHSDLDAPCLDLGWPQQFGFVGPTEVTTLVNPPDPEMPSIKEQVRRMIKNAQQVVAVVMDMFTDVDIFADILNAAMRGVTVYILLDELNAHHFVSMVNNCRVNLDEIKFMRVRTVPGTTYFCHTGKSLKGQMMDRFILVDCRAVLTGNYSFMWSFEKIHRCLAHLFLGQLVTTFDEEFRILFAHSEPLDVEKVLGNMSHYSNIQEGHLNKEKTHMFNREFPNMLPEWAGHYPEDHMNVGDKMLPYKNIEPTTQPFREGHPFMEHGRQMRGQMEMSGFKRHGYPDVPDYGYMPPQNHPTMRGKQFTKGVVPKGGHCAREPGFYQGAGLQPDYDIYGRFKGQGHHIDQFSGPGYPHEVNEAEPPGAYDHVQRYLKSQSPMEDGHGARNLLSAAQSNPRRHSMGQSYACQTSPTQPNLPDQKQFFNANRKPQDTSQKQGLRDWRISSYLSAFDDGEDMDFPELEGSDLSDNVPCFVPEGPGGPMGAEIRPGNIEFNRMMPPSRNNPPFIQIRNSSPPPLNLVYHPPDLVENIKIPIAIKTPPTSESSCTTEGDKVEETPIKKPKEINLFGEEFLRSKPTRAVQRSSRLRHSLIFSSNLELNTSEDSKDVDEASKLTARVSQIMDKRWSSAREPFQWSSFVRSATVDDRTIESARSEASLNKIGVDSDVSKVNNSQDVVQEKKTPETIQSTALEEKSKRDEAEVWQRSSSFVDMNDPDSRFKYFKELAAKRKAELATAKASQSNPQKAQKKSEAPEKPSTSDGGKKAAVTTPTIQDAKCQGSSEAILHRATDTEKIRFKQKLAEESLNSSQKDTAPTLNTSVETSTESQKCTQKTICTLPGKSSQPVINPPSKPSSRNVEALSVPAPFEIGFSQNQVDSDGLNTASSETLLTQFHIPKETGPSRESPAVNLSQSKCLSPLNITPNESNQTPAQTSPHTSNTISNTVSADSKLIKGEQTQKHSAMKADSSQQPTATENAQKPNVPGSLQQPAPMKTDSSQHPPKTETDSSHQPTALGSVSTQTLAPTETDSSQKPIVMNADSSQQLSATAQKQTTMEGEPTTAESKSFQHPAAKDANSFQQPTPTENKHAQSTATEPDSSQHTSSAETDSSQQPNALEVQSSKIHNFTVRENEDAKKTIAMQTEALLPPPATIHEHAQEMSVTKTEALQQPPAAEDEHALKPIAMETEAWLPPTATQDEHAPKPNAAETESVQQPPATEDKHAQKTLVAETESVQKSPVTENEQTPKTTALKVDSFQQPTELAVNSSTAPVKHCQNPTGTEVEPFLQPTLPETDSSQHPTKAVSESSQQHTATGTDVSQQPFVTENELAQKTTESSQQPAALGQNSKIPTETETEPAQNPTTTGGGSLQHPLATENEPAQKPAATEGESSQHPTTTDSPQQPAALGMQSSKIPTATENEHVQNPYATEAESLQHLPAKESNSSQQPTKDESELIQELTSEQADCFQQSTVIGADSSQKSTPTEADVSQQVFTEETQSTEPSVGKDVGSFQDPSTLGEESSQHLTTTKHEPSQHPTETDSFKEPAETLHDLQNPTETDTDSSHKPTESDESISTECESISHPTETKCVSASPSTLKVTLSPQTISFSDTIPADSHILFHTGSVSTSTIETNTDQNILITTVCTIQSEAKSPEHSHAHNESKVVLPTITSLQETSSATSEQKDDDVCQDFSKQGSISTTNITPENNGLSQSIIITDSFSAEHISEKPCPQTDDGKMELNFSLEQTQTKPSVAPAVKDADNAVSLSSVAVNSNELHDSTEPDTTQQSVTTSIQESGSLNDPKPEDELQQHEEQPQRHDSSDGSEMAKVSITTETNQTTPENCVSNLAEVSEKSESTVTLNSAENAKSQSAMTENPKPIPSAHQSSTANVISCSNLRDDTKVLLEQISAKNQRTKQTLASANEEKEGGVKSEGQQLSSFTGRPWSSKASAEEKEILLQKMEKMRKERKVYSRFE